MGLTKDIHTHNHVAHTLNRCDSAIYLYEASAGGVSGDPVAVEAGGSLSRDWVGGGDGTSIKIGKTETFEDGILQFEYARPDDGIYWDLSDLDGTPFRDSGVTVTPSGAGETAADAETRTNRARVGDGNCAPISCAAGEVCEESFQTPTDNNVRFCPSDIDEFAIDLC